MIVDSFNMEFGYELLSAVPYAYELHLKGELEETISGHDTAPLYYFSPKHTENTITRGWHNMGRARRGGLPYTFIHQPEQPAKEFPPYKEIYANEEYKYEKPILCIGNRKNTEWNVEAINFFDEEILDWMFTNLKDQYEIIYFPVAIPKELQDNVDPHPLEDKELARKHGIKLFTDLCEGKSWNETILKVYANCEYYITMNGGYSILASMFSGTNIIYSKPGKVQTKEIVNGSFWRWYPDINNVRTLHVPSYEDLKQKVRSLYIDKKPCLNILIRTTRPNYLKKCVGSIEAQTYDNINVVLICDTDHAVKYTREYKARLLRVEKRTKAIEKKKSRFYGKGFPYNRYLDQAQKLVNGYILMLDDDDELTEATSVERIVANADKDSLLIWKVQFNSHGILPKHSFGEKITLYDITGIGFCYHTSQIKHTDWSEWKRADYRTAKKLSKKVKVEWLDEILTGIQDSPGRGLKGDLPDSPAASDIIRVKLTYEDGWETTQLFKRGELETYEDYFKRYKICTEQVT
jgi:hypothetical protein